MDCNNLQNSYVIATSQLRSLMISLSISFSLIFFRLKCVICVQRETIFHIINSCLLQFREAALAFSLTANSMRLVNPDMLTCIFDLNDFYLLLPRLFYSYFSKRDSNGKGVDALEKVGNHKKDEHGTQTNCLCKFGHNFDCFPKVCFKRHQIKLLCAYVPFLARILRVLNYTNPNESLFPTKKKRLFFRARLQKRTRKHEKIELKGLPDRIPYVLLNIFEICTNLEVFQKRISQHLDDLEGVATEIDDILIWGSDEQEHDARLEATLQRCEEINLALNVDKCKFNVNEVSYCGHNFTKDGVKPDESKIKAIQDMPTPSSKKEIERLLGTVNYLAKFVPNLATITAPIRELLKKDIEFYWSHEQTKAFDEIKEILTQQPVLKFFDPTKPVIVRCDASQNGLGAVLIQEEQPIAYAFNAYTYGVKVLVENDHKPLEIILKKSLHDAPLRLQRMLLRLQKYDFTYKHKPGKDLVVADTLSRAPLPITDSELEKEISCYVHMLKKTVLSGWPDTKRETPVKIKEYWHCREEISEIDGILLKNEKIIIPSSFRPEMLEKIHAGHMGTEKCKKRARDVLYWPGMNSQIEEMVLKCPTCLEYRPSNQKEPMIVQPTPTIPWDTVATDLFYWNNSNYLLVVDYFSRYFEIAKLPDIKSSTLVTYMKSIFARHGIPREVKSDNGPQYTSQEFGKFSQEWNFQHTTTSPYHPQANGLVERLVQTVKNLLNKANRDGRD
ncbi:retrotransposon-like family member retr-1 [Paramuricea clavata]|uniref:Retrotransposon-like family member retr-1 n=1 Tax=Paramuricea clavata TaxID=317549 RepID=A0A6S7HAY2_PARCT|nr:retrotransposon-like family member retr-1 [Paramuricea clavata]